MNGRPARETIRAFLALPLSADQREEIASKIAPLHALREPVRWVAAENLHVTLRFFGDLGAEGRSRIEERAASTARSISPFDFRLGKAGAFPNLHAARVLWIGISDGEDAVALLAARIEESIAGLGFAAEKRFHAHTTVGRTKGRLSGRFQERFSALAVEPLRARATSFHLMKSDLTPSGARYAIVRDFPLAP